MELAPAPAEEEGIRDQLVAAGSKEEADCIPQLDLGCKLVVVVDCILGVECYIPLVVVGYIPRVVVDGIPRVAGAE